MKRPDLNLLLPKTLLVFASGLLGCATATPHRSFLEGEAYFVAPYVYARACGDGKFSLTFSDRSNTIIETAPPIEESTLRLQTCRDDMSFLLDCTNYGYGQECGAHDWPLPQDSTRAAGDNEVAHELATVAALAPRCPREKSCARFRNGDLSGRALRRCSNRKH